MDQDQAFLKVIRQRPGSMADRLVYADWHIDRGDPRGDFIHCQVRARRLPRGSPQRLDLEAQAHELLLVHEVDWLGPMLGAIGNWEWSGGFLNWVTVAADVFLNNAERWLPALPLLGVHLRKARPHVAALARCKQLALLSGLSLGYNALTDKDLAILLRSPHLKRVRSLFLQSNDLSEQGIRILAQTPNLPRLRELCLGANRIGDEAVASLASSPHLARLRALHLTLVGVDEAGLRALAGSPLLSRLRFLAVGLNHLPAGCLAALAREPAFASLRVLGYEMNRPDDADIAALASSPHATGLRDLSLEGYQSMRDAGVRALASSPSLGQLRSLTIGSGPWGGASARTLGRSRTLTALRSLQVTPGEGRGRQVVKALLGQPLIRRLRHLNLQVTRIGKEGLASPPVQWPLEASGEKRVPVPLRGGRICRQWFILLEDGEEIADRHLPVNPTFSPTRPPGTARRLARMAQAESPLAASPNFPTRPSVAQSPRPALPAFSC